MNTPKTAPWTGANVVGPKHARRLTAGYWIVTSIFAVQMAFTAYAQLRLPQVAEAFAHLGFPAYFRVELSCAKLFGLALLLAPVPPRLKEWAYAGFAIDIGSAVIAHVSVGDGPESWGWAVATGVLWGLSYLFWRRLQAAPAAIRALPSTSRHVGTAAYPEAGA